MGLLPWLFGHDPASDSIAGEIHAIEMAIPVVNPATGPQWDKVPG